MKRLLIVAAITLLFLTVSSAARYLNKLNHSGTTTAHITLPTCLPDNSVKKKLSAVATIARQYAATKNFNTQFCFLADMAIASGHDRFFVYDMKKNAVVASGLVTHGRCNQNWLTGRKYGNAIGCGCTSLGKYKVGNAYKGRFGLAYKLYGLDAGNSNAFDRFVVLHSMQCVPEREVDPYPICQSDGCPTVSPGFLRTLSSIINTSEPPVLLWIYH